jgi:hypothetical protein
MTFDELVSHRWCGGQSNFIKGVSVMAIDVFSEKIVSLKEAIRLLPKSPRNKRLHVSTLYRWTLGGLRSKDGMIVRLESVKNGGTTCTSQEALQRFFDRLSGDERVVVPPTLTRRQRLRQIEQAEEELRRAGI